MNPKRIGIIFSICLWGWLLTPLAEGQNRKDGFQQVSANYYIEHVSDPAKLNWQILSVETALGIATAGDNFGMTLIPRLNLGQRTGSGTSFFDHTAVQGQLDAYLNFTRKMYLFTGYGYSGSHRFAKHQAFAELNYALPKGWGLTAGVKMAYWDNAALTYLLGVEKYVGPCWITLRPMLVVQDGKAFMAARSAVRYYIKEPRSFLTFGLYYGNSPEYANYLPDLRFLLSLGSYGTYLNWQQALGSHFAIRMGISYRREEYRDKTWRNVIGANTGLTYNF